MAGVAQLGRDPQILASVGVVAAEAARRMAQRAPRQTGGAAASIHAEPDPAMPGYRVGWDVRHFYLSFAELGTEDQPARPFARPTADEFNSRR